MTDRFKLADLLFPDVTLQPEHIAARYPARELPPGACVTRFAPSPTGWMTIGGLYAAWISATLARQSGGLFYVRIEDTDRKREVDGSAADLVESLRTFGIAIDEGPIGPNLREVGRYGPYRQSRRVDLYRVWAKQLVRQNLAYPCFCTEEELQAIRDKQQAAKQNTGYYGQWAVCRHASYDEIEEKLENGRPFVLRLKSPGSAEGRIRFVDRIKGEIELQENDQDIVLLKSDGVPTYHFAHAIDDHLMGTTHVFRGDEWLSSVPIHMQLFRLLGFRAPEYGHLAPLMKMDGSSKRKFSKRKDLDAAARYYWREGYPSEAVAEYFMTLIDPGYEAWRRANPFEPCVAFRIDTSRMNASGALFDMQKLTDISKDVIARFGAEEVYRRAATWAETYDRPLHDWLTANERYAVDVFGIGRTPGKPRKDFAKWSELGETIAYYDDTWYEANVGKIPLPPAVNEETAKRIVRAYAESLDFADDREGWFGRMQRIAESIGFAKETKLFKKHPESYAGHVGDVAAVIRAVLTGKLQAPDLYDMMRVMGENRVRGRLKRYLRSNCG